MHLQYINLTKSSIEKIDAGRKPITPSHSAAFITGLLMSFKWEVNPHPPYSHDVSPYDFGIVGRLKKFLQRRRSLNDEKVKEGVDEWNKQGRNFWRNCANFLRTRWTKYME